MTVPFAQPTLVSMSHCCHLGWRSVPTFGGGRRQWTGTVLYYTVLYCTVLYCTVLLLYCTVLYCTVLYCTVLYCTVLYCTILQYILQCCTVLYCSVLYCRGGLYLICFAHGPLQIGIWVFIAFSSTPFFFTKLELQEPTAPLFLWAILLS